jgi:NitT/TauT family transport system substrate-binding protein
VLKKPLKNFLKICNHKGGQALTWQFFGGNGIARFQFGKQTLPTQGLSCLILCLFLVGCGLRDTERKIRVGYCPNLTHAQALIGMSQKKFEAALGPEVMLETRIFNAGPSGVEALFAGALDIAYLGPGPAINAYVRSKGDFKIIAGAAEGGAGLVVQKDLSIQTLQDLRDKTIGTPQLGNTQDITARAWFKKQGFTLKEKGGTLKILPIANPDQMTLFMSKELDAVWTVEPWISRLLAKKNAQFFLDERQVWKPITGGPFCTAVVLVNKAFLEKNPDLVEQWIKVHWEITQWIEAHPEQAKTIMNSALKELLGEALEPDVLDRAFSNVKWSVDPIEKSLFQQAQWAYEEGFLGKEEPDLSGIFDATILNRVMGE